MAVNALVTGLIVFKIQKALLEAKATSVERTFKLGSAAPAAGNPKLQHIIFVIIESGMALFVIQLVRIILSSCLLAEKTFFGYPNGIVTTLVIALDLVTVFHEMLIVIIKSVRFYFVCFSDKFYLVRESHQR